MTDFDTDMEFRCQHFSVSHRGGIHEPYAAWFNNEQDELDQPSTEEQVFVETQVLMGKVHGYIAIIISAVSSRAKRMFQVMRRRMPSKIASVRSCVHVVVLSVFLIRRWCRCPLLDQLFSVERAGGVELEPGCDAFEVEEVILVAGKLDNERVRV